MRSSVVSCMLILTSVSCSQKAITKADGCDGVACTMSFAMLNVTITDASGKGVKLDSFYTLRAGKERIVNHNNGIGDNNYTLLDDSYVKKLQNSKDNFTFVGYRNGAKVVNEAYVISADCCHIKKESGNTDIRTP